MSTSIEWFVVRFLFLCPTGKRGLIYLAVANALSTAVAVAFPNSASWR